MATLRELVPGLDSSLGALIPGAGAAPPAAGLRAPDVRALDDASTASDMGQLRRGFTSGRLGAQANVLRAQQAGLRAQGLEDEAAALEPRVGAIQGRAATFAPVEQDVTALGLNPGRIVDWGLGAMGSAGASMLDPIALAAGANVAGSAVSMIPHPAARLAGGALRLGGAAGAFGLNAEQMKGEFVNDAYADPALMQRTTPQALNTAANFTGAAGGALDTILPVAAAGRITGRAGKKALAGTGAAGKLGLDMAGEGVTETAQGELKRGTLGVLNPERDTSGDTDARLNEFAAGAVGSAPISGVSQLAAKGYERLGVKDDTSSDDVSGKAKPKARENLTERLVRGAKEHADDDAAEAWNATLQGVGSGDIDADTTMRHEALLKELGGRAEKGDATAKQHLDVLSAMDPADAGTWYDDAPRDEAFKHILGDGKDHAKVVEAYRGRRKNEQGAMGDARTQLAASIMTDELGDADGDVKGAASDLARQLASFSKREKAKFADNLAVMELAAKAVQLYGGKQAQAVVAKVATALGVEQTPLMKQLQQNLAGAADIAAWRSGQRKSRTAAAAELVAMVPPETTLKLRKLGLDLTTASGQLSLLDRVQDFANAGGRTRSEFASTFGPEVADKMIAAVAPGKVIERETAGEKKASGGEKTEVATESDEVSAEAAEDGDDWELAGALKNIDKAPGTKLYLAKGRGAVSSTEGSPFVPDRKTKNLPTLSSVDDTDDGAGEPGSGPKTLDAMIAKAWTALGGQEFNDPVVKVERSGGVTRRTTTVPDPMAAVPSAPGKPGAPQTFGVGSYRIRAASAREVMDAHGLSANKRVELLKAYLARPGKKGAPPLLGEGDPTIQQLATLDRKIKISERETPAKTYAAVGKDGGSVLLDNPAYTELQDLKGQRKEVMAKLAARIGVVVGEDATVPELADAYFDIRFLVTAEQMAEKDQLRLDVAEVRAMIRRGNDDLDFTDQFGDEKMDVQASMNLLRFKSKSAVSKDGIAVIRANDLVSWVRDNRNDKAPRKVNSPERVALAFRNDLMEGIGALAADGHLGEMPYMLNEQGKKESFKDGFPPTLRLSGLTQGALDVRKAERAKKVKPFVGPPDENAVAREQTAELEVRNTDAEELLDQGKEAPRVFQKPKWPARPEEQLTPEQTARYWDAPRAETADELRRRSLGPRDKEGKPLRVSKYPTAPETVETRTDDNRVPSELEPVEQRSGVPTERTDIAMRTAVANSALDKVETLTVANAPAKSKRMAEKLWAGLGRSSPVSDVKANPVAGWQAVLDVFETMRSGKLHYAAPLARLLTPANVQRLVDTAKDPAKAKVMLRGLVGEVAAALAKMPDSGFSRAEKTVLARLLTGNETLVASKVGGALTAMVPKSEAKAVAPAKTEPTADKQVAWVTKQLTQSTAKLRAAVKDFTLDQLDKVRLAIYDLDDGADHFGVDARAWSWAASHVESRMSDLEESGDTRKNQQTATRAPSTDAEIAEAKAYVAKVLGPKITVLASSTFPDAGEWNNVEQTIRLSTATGPGILSVAYHEAMHGLWARLIKNSPSAAQALAKVMSSPNEEAAQRLDAGTAQRRALIASIEESMKNRPETGPDAEAAVGAKRGKISALAAEVDAMTRQAERLKGKDANGIYARLKALLANEPAALAAITTGPHAVEERVAYAYQFWAAGLLDVDKPATTVFAKVRKFLRKVLGMVRESETALDIMTAFHDGKLAEPSAAGRVIDKIMKDSTWNEDVKRKFDKQVQGIHAAVATSNQVLRAEKLSATARKLGMMMFTNPGEATAGRFKKGYINARRQVTAQYTNYLYDALKGLSPRDMEAAAKHLQLKTPLDQIPYAPVREAVKGVRALTKRYWTYATGDAGMKLEYLGDDHYPRVWSLNGLVEEGGKDKFIAMLLQPKYAKTLKSATDMVNENLSTPYTTQQIAEQMYQHLIDKNGVDEKGLDAERAYSELIAPFFASQKERSFKWLDDADVEPFLEKDLVGAMSRYLHQGVRAAEYVRRFGEGGKDLKEMLAMKGDTWINPETDKKEDRPEHGAIAGEIVASLKAKGITGKDAEETLARHMEDIRNSVEAHEGSLGRDIKPAFRKLSSGLMAYQNLRLLPLSLFAAFGDTVGIAGRFGDGGGKLAFQAFMQGLRDVYARWKAAASDMPAERKKSTWENLAEMIGAVDSHMFLEQMGKAHTSEFMTDFARKANRALFMANGLTAWDRSMRVSATKAAVLFLEHHASLPDKAHSRRWLAELGLAAKDIPLDAEGKLITDRHVLAATKGIPIDQATAEMERIHYALTRWVEGAVLTPNAGQRPTWASDPHYAVLFHLKQFTYSFQDTILKRAFAEASHGNMSPIGALAAAVPTMIAADMVKGLVVGGGSFPDYMKAWDAGDWIAHGASRAGLAGVGQFGIDALSDPTSLFGPTVDQVTDFIWNPTEIGHNIHNAIPGARMIKGLPDLTRVAE